MDRSVIREDDVVTKTGCNRECDPFDLLFPISFRNMLLFFVLV